jgi:alkaline phosphatase
MLKRLLLVAMLCAVVRVAAAEATTIYPIDRATILVGSRFDFKVEFDEVIDARTMRVTIDGADYAAALGNAGQFVAKEAGTNASALLVRNATLTQPGPHAVVTTDGTRTATVQWEVYRTGPRQARNVILFIGDGMSAAHRTAARILSKGIAEGRYRGTLAMDDMP